MNTRRRAGFAVAASLLLIIEIIIAIGVRDRFVRPYLGDVLAVLLIYTCLRAAGVAARWSVALALFVAVVIELGQLFGLLDALGLQRVTAARVVLGSGFDRLDLVAYGCGGALAMAVEEIIRRRSQAARLGKIL